jgi:NADPH-dependent glutamate synthase beta subunit-like oxidoreductase/Pyruvate/2-oxoacid:ferredoxin oxidoreductase delta subunit/coenzyme F420-reducing hydrogenase delta subunit
VSTLLIPSLQPDAFPVAQIRPSPCTLACPAGINVKGYVSLIAERRYDAALETIRRRCPLPAVCGRVCHHPCEKACRRGRYDDPVAIRALKRFAADYADADYATKRVVAPPPIAHEHRVAVVGSGPAGLTAAYDLRQAGYGVTVFESAAEPGGMLRYGIADYRLPHEVLDHEIDVLCRSGVEIVTGQTIGANLELDDLLYRGYAVTLLAVGAQRGRALEGAEDALSFLRRVKQGDRTRMDGRVLVIGGGSTAVEAARSALRLGAQSVEILYRRYREELLADREEIEAAEAEGVRFRFLVAPRRLVRGGLECVQIGLGEPDASGRRRPIEIPGSELVAPAEHVLGAVGQQVDFTFLPNELARIAGRDRLLVDNATAMTSIAGIFAAGDAVTGPATVVEAIGAGHRAAESIRHFLEEGRAGIREQKPERRAPVEYELPDPEPTRAARIRVPLAADGFAEVERAFTEAEAVAEARRCLRCGPCGECSSCAPSCTRRHVVVDDVLLRVPASIAASLPSARPTAAVHDGQTTTVLPVRCRVDDERCRACGRCIDVCPFQALRILDERIKLDAALCRGCGLCTAVCPTATVTLSAPAHIPDDASDLVLACQRRTGSIEKGHVIRLRCVGQIDAGLLLELQRDGKRKICVAGCTADRCRFTTGAQHAVEQLERARAIARILRLDPDNVVADWSPDRLHDPLDHAPEGGH